MNNEIIGILESMGIEDEINEKTKLISDLYLDSAELVSLRLELKKKFNVDIPLSSEEEMTVEDLKKKVEAEKSHE